MSKTSYLLKNTGILAIGSFSSKILVFLLVPLYTAALTTAEYGAYDIIYSSIGLLIPILTLNISDAVLRFPLEGGADVPRIARTGLGITLVSGVLVLAAQLIPGAPWAEIQGAGYIPFLYLAVSLYQLLTMLARGAERMADVAIAGVLSTVAMVVLNIVLLLVLDWGLDGFFVANIAGMVLPAAYLLLRMRRLVFSPAKSAGADLLVSMVRYAVPLAATVVGWWFISASGRYIVTLLCGMEANGLYSIAYKIPAILSAVAGIFIQAWQVSAIKEFDSKDEDRFLTKTFDNVEALLVLLCSLLIAAAPLVAQALFSGGFYSAWQYVPFLLVSALLNTMGGMFSPFYSARMDTAPMAVSTFLGGAVSVGLGIPLVLALGVQGAAVASLAACLVNWAYRGVKVRRHIEIDFHLARSLRTYAVLVVQGAIMVSGLPPLVVALAQVFLVSVLVVRFRASLKSQCAFAARALRKRRDR